MPIDPKTGKELDPNAALAGLQGAAPQAQQVPLSGAAPAHGSYEAPADSMRILQSGSMLSNASAANQGMLGGYGSMEELRRHASLPDTFTQHTPADMAGQHGYGYGQATGSQAYAQGLLNAINQGAARKEAGDQQVAEQGFARQFGMPFKREQTIYDAQTGLDPTVTREANAVAERSPAAIAGRAQIESADIAANAEKYKAKVAADAVAQRAYGSGTDEFTKGAFEALKEIDGKIAEYDLSGRTADRDMLLRTKALYLQALGLAPGGPQAQPAPAAVPHGKPGHQHSVMEDYRPSQPIGAANVPPNMSIRGRQDQFNSVPGQAPQGPGDGSVTYNQWQQMQNLINGLNKYNQRPGVQ